MAVIIAMTSAAAFAQQPVITPQWDVDQKKLESGGYQLPFVLQAGQRFFTTPYSPYNSATKSGDGYCEGPNGPRWTARQVFYRGTQYGWPFLRLNGLHALRQFDKALVSFRNALELNPSFAMAWYQQVCPRRSSETSRKRFDPSRRSSSLPRKPADRTTR